MIRGRLPGWGRFRRGPCGSCHAGGAVRRALRHPGGVLGRGTGQRRGISGRGQQGRGSRGRDRRGRLGLRRGSGGVRAGWGRHLQVGQDWGLVGFCRIAGGRGKRGGALTGRHRLGHRDGTIAGGDDMPLQRRVHRGRWRKGGDTRARGGIQGGIQGCIQGGCDNGWDCRGQQGWLCGLVVAWQVSKRSLGRFTPDDRRIRLGGHGMGTRGGGAGRHDGGSRRRAFVLATGPWDNRRRRRQGGQQRGRSCAIFGPGGRRCGEGGQRSGHRKVRIRMMGRRRGIATRGSGKVDRDGDHHGREAGACGEVGRRRGIRRDGGVIAQGGGAIGCGQIEKRGEGEAVRTGQDDLRARARGGRRTGKEERGEQHGTPTSAETPHPAACGVTDPLTAGRWDQENAVAADARKGKGHRVGVRHALLRGDGRKAAARQAGYAFLYQPAG